MTCAKLQPRRAAACGGGGGGAGRACACVYLYGQVDEGGAAHGARADVVDIVDARDLDGDLLHLLHHLVVRGVRQLREGLVRDAQAHPEDHRADEDTSEWIEEGEAEHGTGDADEGDNGGERVGAVVPRVRDQHR